MIDMAATGPGEWKTNKYHRNNNRNKQIGNIEYRNTKFIDCVFSHSPDVESVEFFPQNPDILVIIDYDRIRI
jgi:hypothetical protein